MAQHAPASGIAGSILISPALGGPARQGGSDARPLAQTEFVVQEGERVVASFRTDAEGRFQVSLGPGRYSIVRKEKAAMGFFGPFAFEVKAGEMKTVRWTCDSGMR